MPNNPTIVRYKKTCYQVNSTGVVNFTHPVGLTL